MKRSDKVNNEIKRAISMIIQNEIDNPNFWNAFYC